MRTIHDWLKYVEHSKRHVGRGDGSAPPAAGPTQPSAPRGPATREPSVGSARQAPPPERQVPPPVRVKREAQTLPPSVRPIEAEQPAPQRKLRGRESQERVKELMASLDTALQTRLPLPSTAKEAPPRRRKRSSFSESRDGLLRRLIDPELRLREVALLLSVCPATVRRYANRGVLTAHRTAGNQRRFRLSEVVDFVHARRNRSRRASGGRSTDRPAAALDSELGTSSDPFAEVRT